LRLKILKNLRTASLNSEFTGSYKKSVTCSDSSSSTLTVEANRRTNSRSATRILLKEELENGKFLRRYFENMFSVT